MKHRQTRISRSALDQATIEQIQHARGMNVPVNGIVSAALFTEKINRSLFGERKPGSELNAVLQDLIAKAREERALEDMRERERVRSEKESQQRVILTGGRN